MSKRMVAVFAAVLLAFGGIMARLYTLTDGQWQEAAGAQSKITVTVARARGTIYDRKLLPLTNTEQQYKAAVVSTPQALSALAQVLSDEDWQRVREQLETGKPAVVDFEKELAMTKGITLAKVPVRYSGQTLAPHIIGYVGDDGIHGVSGIEKAMDAQLIDCGGEVKVTYETDGRGQVLAGGKVEIKNTLSQTNGGVALTLDAAIQRVVECRSEQLLKKGAVVVMDPQTGHLLAAASFPSFQPSSLSDYLSAEDSPLFNRVTASYNCGSVFKIVSAAAALEAGIPMVQSYYCGGRVQIGNNVIKCHDTLGHGWQTMYGGFIHSCNPYFIRLIQSTGADALYRMASSMSFDSGLVLADGFATASAVFPSMQTLLQPAALANVSFGQGELTATPIHIAQMTAAVNGGVMHPVRLVLGTVSADGQLTENEGDPPVRVFTAQTAQALCDMMRGVVEEGNGEAARPEKGGAGGKTGTAQTGWKLENGETMVQSWFTGFYPAENPQYVITVLSEDAGTSGQQAAPVFKAICDDLQRMLDKTDRS